MLWMQKSCGLSRVLDTIESSKELLLSSACRAAILALEDVVSHVGAERRQKGVDPSERRTIRAVVWVRDAVPLSAHSCADAARTTTRPPSSYRQWSVQVIIPSILKARFSVCEIVTPPSAQGQITQAGSVMLHYDDATLKDLYFLDPQWLCDMLAHVVTIREINPFARTGVMKLDDLKHVFKSSNLGPVDTRGYIVNLLNKFEVALTWDNRTLLIPSLLPSEDDPHTPSVKVKIPVRSRGWAVRNKKLPPTTSATTVVGNSSFYADSPTPPSTDSTSGLELNERSDPELAIRRMLLMSYFPSGFWSRLMTRLLADDAIVDIVRSFVVMPKEVAQDAKMAKLLDVRAEWVLWQTGMELRYSDVVLFRMKEVISSVKNSPIDYRKLRLKLKQEGVWADMDLVNSSILEVLLPLDTIVIKRPITDNDEQIGYQAIVLDPSPECAAQLLALAVDHIDILLEDWYPTLGTRFVHTSEGKFLVTRIVPCPRCLASSLQENETDNSWPTSRQNLALPNFSENLNEDVDFNVAGNASANRRVRKSQESYTSDGDSGVGPDSAGSSRKPSMEGHPEVINEDEEAVEPNPQYSWMVEECILAAYDKKSVKCPLHGDISLAHIAPDTMFLDLGERHLIRPNSITRGHLLGRGAFGFVFKGTCKVRGSSTTIDVAMKMLQPVAPGPNASQSAVIAYKGAQGKWDRDPLQYASKAYCTARQELNILLTLRHPNIVPLVGVCTKPLALVLDLAPLGALDITLRNYRRSGAKLGAFTLQAVILQVAKAIEYLHQQHIIYRDLKSENVLVWSMPPPFQDHLDVPVYIKLADYGISRLTLPSGTKGFGGTEGFMAPEIMRYNGEEECTEKVDCFSFGMFIYELLTLHQPFESHESVKECILEGGRPPLTYRETLYPSYMLDLMVLCWCQQPRDRPSASQIVSIASAPEFTHLHDIVSLNHPSTVVATASFHAQEDGASSSGEPAACGGEMWLACANKVTDQLMVSGHSFVQYSSLVLPEEPTAACLVGNSVWLGDCKGQIHAYFVGDCTHIFSYALDPDSPDNAGVCAILHLERQSRVAVGLCNGRVFLVRDDLSPAAPTMAEGSFVMSELGSSSVLHAITAVYTDNDNECQLWCGESDGALSVYTMHENIVTGHKVLNHYEPIIANVHVHQIVSSHSPIMYEGPAAVWTYVHPGTMLSK
ncbi:hypothetical protein LSTR_LSTR013926 [Laodelphax striatellus]|uniref:Protein kinase domain-containing protein n=1 Tax=Laodelphax striatellus TaxID=195883 RepID=A0A482X5W0_LAOST|nr:hypothetical protein LSTR_LSTR013926 [Laodelphax striatellus]